MSSANIKVSNTSRIFDDNNFSKFLPVVGGVELLQKLSGKAGSNYEESSYLGDKLGKMNRSLFGSNKNNEYIEIQKISELLQSVAKYGLYTSEILSDVVSIDGIGDSVKISYLRPETLDEIYKNSSKEYENLNLNTSRVLNNIQISKIFKEKQTDINALEKDENKTKNLENIRPNKGFFHNKAYPGLSVIQVLNPDLRACFKQSQEIDAFFNLISTLDITMAMPYVNVDFIIPATYKKLSGDVGNQVATKPKKYITASLNNLFFGADYASNENNFTKNDFAINGSYDINTVSNQFIRGEQGTIKKSEYERQHMTNAIFMAPQTMINADIEKITGTEFGDRSKNSLIDKFRPFMSILDLSFDVRPQKGFLFYKTASLNLMLYDKARMPEIAPFIKPELLNSHSSELALEYGWQHNLGDNNIISNEDIVNRNPIAQFINSLKVVEKYVITNSSYTINENGTVNISLSLAMKGPVELRNTAMPTDDNLSKLDAELLSLTKILLNDTLNQTIEGTSKQSFPEYNQAKNKISKTNLDKITLKKLREAIAKEEKENVDVGEAEKKLILNNALKTLEEVEKTLTQKEAGVDDFLKNSFDFLDTTDGSKYIHNANWKDQASCNDPFIDESWWKKYLGDDWTTSNPHKWISLGKIITCVLGKILSKTKKYNEIQLVFYNINGKSIRASYLNIASVPVEFEKFKEFLKAMGNRLQKISVETFISAILNRCINQKAAAVYGLDKFFTFNDENKTVYNTSDQQQTSDDDKQKVLTEEAKKNEQKQINMSVKAEILNQYYGQGVATAIEGEDANHAEAKVLQEVSSLIDLTFKPARVVMNFDSTFHEVDKESSILRVSFYDENDNPYEALTDVISSIQSRNVSNALSTINIFRSRKKERLNKNKEQSSQKNTDQTSEKDNNNSQQTAENKTTSQTTGKNDDETIPTDERLNADALTIVNDLIKKKIVSLIIKQDNVEVETTNPSDLTSDNLVRIKINVSDDSLSKKFINLKQMFKSYMPSLTLGQTNSALISGNVTTNQDAKYATALLMKQNGEIVSDEPSGVEVELFDELDSSPMFVMPSQATASIIGCPLINFSQLIFMDFNTGTTVDNIYFVNGIKHSISPGKFSTELTLVQNDLFTRYEAQSTTIANFLKSLTEFKATQEIVKKQAETRQASIPKTTKKVVPPPKIESVTLPSVDKQFTLETSINYTAGLNSKNSKYIGNAFNLDILIKIPSITTQQATYEDNGQNVWTFTRSRDNQTLTTRLENYIGNVKQEYLTETILFNARKLLTEFFKIIGKIDEILKDDSNIYTGKYKFDKYIINSGFRDPELNKAVGGKDKSRHLIAEALDFKIQVTDGTTAKLLDSRIVALIIFEHVFTFTGNVGDDKLFQTTQNASDIMTITDRFDQAQFIKAWLEQKKGTSIQYGQKTGTNIAHIGGLGIYPDSSFVHYDIRPNAAQSQLTLWFSSDRHKVKAAVESKPAADGNEQDVE